MHHTDLVLAGIAYGCVNTCIPVQYGELLCQGTYSNSLYLNISTRAFKSAFSYVIFFLIKKNVLCASTGLRVRLSWASPSVGLPSCRREYSWACQVACRMWGEEFANLVLSKKIAIFLDRSALLRLKRTKMRFRTVTGRFWRYSSYVIICVQVRASV